MLRNNPVSRTWIGGPPARCVRAGRVALSVAGVVMAAGVGVAAAAPIYSDNFTAGTAPGWSLVEDGANAPATPINATLGVVSDSGNNALQIELTGAGAQVRAGVVDFPSVTLNGVGDAVTVEFDARWEEDTTATAQDRKLGFGLYDAAGGNGYAAKIDLLGAAGTTAGLYQNAAAARLFDGSVSAILSAANSTNAASFVGLNYARVALTVERVADSVDASSEDLLISHAINGIPITSGQLSLAGNGPKEPLTYTFANLAIGFDSGTSTTAPQPRDGRLFVDNLAVTTSSAIPEPSGVALLALAAPAAGRRRRGI